MSQEDRAGEEEIGPQEPEVGPGSMWFLRGLAALTVLIVLWFLIDAIRG